MIIDGLGAFVAESKENHAWLVHHAKRENVAEIEIEGEDDAAVSTRQCNDLSIRSALHAERSDVSYVVTELIQKLDSLRRDSGISQESHE